jgi:beta-galactosidase
MTKDESGQPSLSRRQLLKGAVGAAALASAIPPLASGYDREGVEAETTRMREAFDFGWKFHKGDAPGAQSPEFSDASWKGVDLPHDWSVEGRFDEKEPSGFCGAYLPTGIAWYRKRFRLADLHRDNMLTVEFDGVFENSEVWINGHFLGKRPYGYVPFFYDLTPHVVFGRDNLITVKVDNSRQTNCRWYSGSGIYRHTWLLSTNRIHIAHWGTFVTTPRVSKEESTVEVKTTVANETGNPVPCVLRTSLLDGEGKVIESSEAHQQVSSRGQSEFVQQIELKQPRLWSVDDPQLYKVHSVLRVQGQIVDEYDATVGIRDAVFDANKGFLLNGERVKLNGVCVHHDGGCVGAAVPERIWERRLEILRELGCNAIRTSHNPVAAEFLDLCDRMGFLVMNEAFDEWKVPKGQIGPNGYSNYFDEWFERDVQNFVRRDRNHPSVVLWSAGNEVGDQEHPRGAETLKKLLDVFHAEDPTRVVTVGCDHICSEPASKAARPEFLSLLDVVGYNYVDRWRDRREKYYSIDREGYPSRRFIGTESEGMGGVRGEYQEFSASDVSGSLFDLARTKNIDAEQLWKFVSTYEYVSGDFMWTGIDHLGEARWPMKSSSTGVLDTCGFKKDSFYFYQSQWTREPVLHLFPHWNWKGKEGQVLPVTCYTNCDTVELFLNGRSFGVKGYAFPRPGMQRDYGIYPPRAHALRTTANLHLSWDVPYEPGTLKAVGMKDGKVAITLEVSTTGEPAALALMSDRQVIAADRRDVAHLTVQILDENSSLVPVADNEVMFSVEGEGILIGVDNGNPRSHEDFKSDRRRAFNGLCLAIVQSTARAGQIRVSANSPSLKSASVTLTSRT